MLHRLHPWLDLVFELNFLHLAVLLKAIEVFRVAWYYILHDWGPPWAFNVFYVWNYGWMISFFSYLLWLGVPSLMMRSEWVAWKLSLRASNIIVWNRLTKTAPLIDEVNRLSLRLLVRKDLVKDGINQYWFIRVGLLSIAFSSRFSLSLLLSSLSKVLKHSQPAFKHHGCLALPLGHSHPKINSLLLIQDSFDYLTLQTIRVRHVSNLQACKVSVKPPEVDFGLNLAVHLTGHSSLATDEAVCECRNGDVAVDERVVDEVGLDTRGQALDSRQLRVPLLLLFHPLLNL